MKVKTREIHSSHFNTVSENNYNRVFIDTLFIYVKQTLNYKATIW